MNAARAYYNEHDPHAAQWLRNLIDCGAIALGDVDERDIRDVVPNELAGYTQCHFFAGIGGWSYALRRAGWPDDRRVWTWSEPCQPFSSAGRKAGFADERYLRPYVHHLVRCCRPPVCFGEQVASKDGLSWLDVIQADMEGEGYAFRAFDLCAAGVGSPHIRQRLFFVADTESERRRERFGEVPVSASAHEGAPSRQGDGNATSANGTTLRVADSGGSRGGRDGGAVLGAQGASSRERLDGQGFTYESVTDGANGSLADSGSRGRGKQPAEPTEAGEWSRRHSELCGRDGSVADSESIRLLGRQDDGDSGRRERASGQGREAGELGDAPRDGREQRRPEPGERSTISGCCVGELADAGGERLEVLGEQPSRGQCTPTERGGAFDRPGPTNGFWRDADWLFCTDGKWRPALSGSFPLVDGAAFRLGSGGPFAGKSRAKMLKGYGNAINAEVAAEFVAAAMEALRMKEPA
jgi:DNA (cytosine-5)-methyltransferase 1